MEIGREAISVHAAASLATARGSGAVFGVDTLVYDSPVPGMPSVRRRLPGRSVTFAPRGPTLTDAPLFDRLTLTPGSSRTRRHKRSPFIVGLYFIGLP
jgi:hypothetical protein